MEWAAYTKAWTAPERTMWLIGRSAGFADFIFTRHFSKASWDSGANNDPKVEDLLVRARQEMDPKRRASYYREIQEIVWQAVPIIPLHTIKVVVLTRANVSGLVVHADEELGLASVKRRP